MTNSTLEDTLAFDLDALGMGGYVRQFRAISGRRFSWDFAYPDRRLLIEVQGATYTKGAHSTGTGLARDYEKGNLATLAGWKCLQFDGNAVKSGEAVEMIRRALEAE